ncbi:MAG: hypothetical protein HY271_21470 [Deltaproteobacteria bacterium]|nr:hypothetical protein [Deltaproteobacteria bacterium]
MPAVDPIERQIRHVRRRRNLHELQRGLFLLIATATGSAAALVLLALRASERLFAAATWSLVGAVVVTAAFLARELGRRWVARDRAAAWIDARARLRGRLTTLVALRARAAGAPHAALRERTERAPRAALPHPPELAFLPLLVEENRARLARWRPEHLVRRRVPLAALVAALAATSALLIAVLLAPRLRPSFPEIVYSDEPVAGAEADAARGATPDRVVVAPRREEAARRHGRNAETPVAGDGDGAGEDDSTLARVSSGLQDRIRRELWGREWERARDAMARAERDAARSARAGRAPGTHAGASGDDRTDSDDGWETAGLPSARHGGRRPSAFGAARTGRATDADDAEAAARGLGEDHDTTTVSSGSGEPAPGAGNETDPNLFGAPTELDPHGRDTFELAISAPVRAQRAGSRRATGEPPAADADGHPELARAAHTEHAIRRMPVPPAYEAIVREVFAHHDVAPDTHP